MTLESSIHSPTVLANAWGTTEFTPTSGPSKNPSRRCPKGPRTLERKDHEGLTRNRTSQTPENCPERECPAKKILFFQIFFFGSSAPRQIRRMAIGARVRTPNATAYLQSAGLDSPQSITIKHVTTQAANWRPEPRPGQFPGSVGTERAQQALQPAELLRSGGVAEYRVCLTLERGHVE